MLDELPSLPSNETYTAALSAASRRIVRNRRKISVEDARDILRLEFQRRGVHINAAELERADELHRGPLWLVLHPIRARRSRHR